MKLTLILTTIFLLSSTVIHAKCYVLSRDGMTRAKSSYEEMCRKVVTVKKYSDTNWGDVNPTVAKHRFTFSQHVGIGNIKKIAEYQLDYLGKKGASFMYGTRSPANTLFNEKMSIRIDTRANRYGYKRLYVAGSLIYFKKFKK